MQVIGLCRFSYPAIGGFQVDHADLQGRIDYLYAPARMEERFATFETFTLPCLRAQTDPDFTFLVVVGDQMPRAYRDRLDALLADLPQAVVQAHPPAQHRQIMKQAINSVRRFDDAHCLQFRLDDDDAVAVTYVAELRAAAQKLLPLAQGRKLIAIDHNQGFVAQPGAHGISATPTQRPYQTAGLALMVAPDARLTVMNFSHVKLPQKMTTVTFTGQDMLVRGHNAYNDSRQGPRVKPVALTPLTPEEETHFKATFNIDADQVRRVFSTLA